MVKISITYEVEDIVPEGGVYICVPCGKKGRFEKGDKFPSCLSCEDGRWSADGGVIPGAELWERVEGE